MSSVHPRAGGFPASFFCAEVRPKAVMLLLMPGSVNDTATGAPAGIISGPSTVAARWLRLVIVPCCLAESTFPS